ISHDSGNPRDQLVPFWQATRPRGYLGWGKSTQLGYSMGLTLGAKLARPDLTVVALMGDAAIGMCGMDLETAARAGIATLTIVRKTWGVGGSRRTLQAAAERYGARSWSGDYAALAASLGVQSERIDQPGQVATAIKRGIDATKEGRPALIEFITAEE